MILAESQWFSPNLPEIGSYFYDIFNNYKKYEKGATLQYHKSKNNFSYKEMRNLLGSTLDTYVPDFPEEVELKLPELNLPKLKKIENV